MLEGVERASPVIEVDKQGLIVSTVTQQQGYVSTGSKMTTKQLPVQKSTTIVPSNSEQIAVPAGVYTTGDIKVAPVSGDFILTNDASAQTGDILAGKTAYVNGKKITGTIPTKTVNDVSLIKSLVIIPKGYFDKAAELHVKRSAATSPSVTLNSDIGEVISEVYYPEGYLLESTKSTTLKLATKPG
jgi:hypothetical protein